MPGLSNNSSEPSRRVVGGGLSSCEIWRRKFVSVRASKVRCTAQELPSFEEVDQNGDGMIDRAEAAMVEGLAFLDGGRRDPRFLIYLSRGVNSGRTGVYL